jgi:hypothetical protein
MHVAAGKERDSLTRINITLLLSLTATVYFNFSYFLIYTPLVERETKIRRFFTLRMESLTLLFLLPHLRE